MKITSLAVVALASCANAADFKKHESTFLHVSGQPAVPSVISKPVYDTKTSASATELHADTKKTAETVEKKAVADKKEDKSAHVDAKKATETTGTKEVAMKKEEQTTHVDTKKVAEKTTVQKKEELLPIGEGAYQDPKAVMQRTVDHNMHCEEGKWADCYKDKGDYLDGHSYGNHEKPLMKSGAAIPTASIAFALSLCVAM
eukprot:CAMPEP_0169138286 /NCGR_PEP_ID=MMETSP1015-20121227/42127_1 /TAXON_ID=342587 /ORGANISM="Karlodinium micrum, Strain CCMP2283" /LENGTH=200 /DNA_ID=CAMNT_0009203459 /DNA_START=58 /DNA_END=660 /DNA_ORIENTATION=-